ncbi:MAG: hypothetical protein U0599_07145 [Vicinamibacteria bacterium]
MAKNERTSGKVATIAGKVLAGKKPTAAEAKILAGSALTQAPNKKR